MNITVVARRSDLMSRHGPAIATQVNIVSRNLLRPAFDSSNACSLFRVISQLQRRGARYPTIGLAKEMKKALQKLRAAQDVQRQ